MADSEAETRIAWKEIHADGSIEDDVLCNLWMEDERAQAYRAMKKLEDLENTVQPNVEASKLDHAIKPVYLPDHPDDPVTDFGAIADAIMFEVNQEVTEVMHWEVDHAEDEHNRLMEEQNRENIARQRMSSEEMYLQRVKAEKANRKELGPAGEIAMMELNEWEMRIQMSMEKFAVRSEILKQLEEDSRSPEEAAVRREKNQLVINKIEESGKEITRKRSEQDPERAALEDEQQDRILHTHLATVLVNSMVDRVVGIAQSREKTMRSIEKSEIKKREIDKARQAKIQRVHEEREERERKRQEEKARKKEIEKQQAEEATKAAEEARERKAKMDALKPVEEVEEVPDEDVPERIAKFRQERRTRQLGEPAVNLQRWDNIEDELGQMMDMLQESGQPGSEMAFAELQEKQMEDAEEYDFKYMYKYKYRALVLDDDQDLPPLGPGQQYVGEGEMSD